MRDGLVRVTSFGPDGTVVTEDGKVWQAMVNFSGSLGLVPRTKEHMVASLDQAEHGTVTPWPPPIESLGLDQ